MARQKTEATVETPAEVSTRKADHAKAIELRTEPKAKVVRKPRVKLATQGISDDGVIVRPKRVVKVKPANPVQPELQVGQLLRMENDSVWSVTSVRFSGADIVCVRSSDRSRVNQTLVISRSAAGHRFVTLEELGEIGSDDAKKAECEDCKRVLAGEEGFDFCPIHGKKNKVGAAGHRTKVTATDEDVATIVRLRGTGMGFAKIEIELGWPDSHGCRSWKIYKTLQAEGKV